jgi:hypothetical protein
MTNFIFKNILNLSIFQKYVVKLVVFMNLKERGSTVRITTTRIKKTKKYFSKEKNNEHLK